MLEPATVLLAKVLPPPEAVASRSAPPVPAKAAAPAPLPERKPGSARAGLSRPMMVALPVVGVIAIGAVGVAVTRSSAPDRPASSALAAPSLSAVAEPVQAHPEPAPSVQVAGTTGDVPAPSALAEKHPKDVSALLVQAGSWLEQKEPERAVAAVARALQLDASIAGDERTASVLWMTAQSKKSSAATFELLRGPMGEKGRTILGDLATTPNVKAQVADEARRALAGASAPPAH